jgi:RIO-like serine/threonine protein kinase
VATRAVEYSRDRRVQRVADKYDLVVSRLAAMDPTVIHGEFYASNVLVGDERVCPIDWRWPPSGPH